MLNRPKVSVVVASYNGAATLKACLHSLEHLNYPEYEVILVDDGSTDATESIAALFPRVRYFRHAENQGLSAARNTGIAAASGEIIEADPPNDKGSTPLLMDLPPNSDIATASTAGERAVRARSPKAPPPAKPNQRPKFLNSRE